MSQDEEFEGREPCAHGLERDHCPTCAEDDFLASLYDPETTDLLIEMDLEEAERRLQRPAEELMLDSDEPRAAGCGRRILPMEPAE